MNNFDYEVMQKKRIAAGARHRKCGSKSKFCALPSDNMTTSEWKRRNGKVKTYSMNMPMTWGEFKSMPLDLQQQYIDTLQTRFNVSVNRISKDLFGQCPDALRRHLVCKGLKHISMPGRGGNVPDWYVWLNDTDPVEEKCESVSEEPVEEPVEETKEELPLLRTQPLLREHDLWFDEPVESFDVSSLTTTFKGEFDPVRFVNWLSALPIPRKKVTITLNVEVN